MIGKDELHQHTCTVQRARLAASASPYHPGQSTLDFATPAAQTSVACRLQRLDSVTITRMTGAGKAGTMVATDYLYIAYSDAPASLHDQDSAPNPESLHRIINVLRADGTTLDTGPFEIMRIVDMGGAADVLKLELKRVV